jgi:hypothetical protein
MNDLETLNHATESQSQTLPEPEALPGVYDETMDVRESLRKQISPELKGQIEQLSKLRNSTERVRAFARVMDDYGVEAIAGLFAEFGDAATSILSGIYLLAETKYSGGSTLDYLKVIGYQTLDFAIGAVPIAGDVSDFLFKANRISSNDLASRAMKLEAKIVKQMREDGMSDSEIKTAISQIQTEAKKLPQLVEGMVELRGKN